MNPGLCLYTFYRSTAAYRVRIALNYKELPHNMISINLSAGEQRGAEYKKMNPHGRVPLLVDGDFQVGQSAAILEYLDEKYPERPLLPKSIESRAWVRYLSQIVVSDMHPVMNNSSVVAYLKAKRGFTDDQVQQWYFQWLKQGFDALETNLSKHPDCEDFCFGKTPTIADVCLIPQVYNAYKFKFPMTDYPTLDRIYKHCSSLDYFEKAKPENQFDFTLDPLPAGLLPRNTK